LEGKYDFDLHFILQEKNAAAGEHIVRARGAWFGNRSISAEVDLEVGTYEVLPKIEASRDADAPDVPEVVTKLAERNPQKLRQIGLNYDIANVKGVFELTEEEQKKKQQKKKEAEEKKKKEKEAEEKERTDFEAWKQEEKAEYEAWKREKERKEKERGKEDISKPSTKEDHTQTDATAVAPNVEDTPASPTAASTRPKVIIDLTVRPKDTPADNELSVEGAAQPTIEPNESSDVEEADLTPDDENAAPQGRFPRPPQSVASRYGRYPGSVYGDVPPPPPAQRTAVKEEPKPWNAVCVLGLRVYSQDPEVSIKLVKPKDVEEGAILDVDGDTPAGATM
jgi:hypothetical protein